MRHLTSTQDWTVDELQALLDQAAGLRSNPVRPLLQGRTLALLFRNRSLRTRASFQIGAHSWAPRRSYWNRGRCCAAANLGGWLCPENCGISGNGAGASPFGSEGAAPPIVASERMHFVGVGVVCIGAER